MKLSFSMKGWEKVDWPELMALAQEMEFQGIELRNVLHSPLTEKGGPFHAHTAAATLRELYEKGLSIPCVDAVCDIADDSRFDENQQEIAACIQTAKDFHIPNIRVHATSGGEVTEKLLQTLEAAAALAEEAGAVVP